MPENTKNTVQYAMPRDSRSPHDTLLGVYAAMREKGLNAHLTPTFDDAESFLRAHWEAGDVVVTLGCGDIDLLNEQIARNGDTGK